MSPKLRTTTITRVLAAALCASGCIETPDFADPSIVDRPRVLAIVAEPPEANPGVGVQLALLLAGADEHRVSWHACGVFDAFGGSQYGDNQEDEGCGDKLAFALGDGDHAALPGELTRSLFLDLSLAVAILGADLPEATIDRVRTAVGMPFLVEATIDAGDKHIRAIKRVLISESETPHSNPPPPHFRLGSREVTRDPDAEFGCRAADGGPLAVAKDREVELAPVVPGGAEREPWLERYSVLDARGELGGREEKAFYSWFSSGGRFQEGITKAPLRNEIWHTPEQDGCYPLWLVVRDGHGGASACGAQVAVGEAACE